MLRIAICCGEGFASGFLTKHLNDELKKEGLDQDYSFTCIPFDLLFREQGRADVAMVMPHVEWKVTGSKEHYNIPIYIIPYKAVLAPTVRDFIEDAEDILAISKQTGRTGLIRFPGEERTQNVSRLVSHRSWVREHSASLR